jgi:hypothetical protein
MLSVLPDGPMIDLFGQVVVPANPSAPLDGARRPMTSVTCGLRGLLSSPSYALQQSLENRLRRQLDGAGSTLFSLTWKRKGTPAHRPYYQLVASARLTSETDFGSWPTPTKDEAGGTPEQFLARKRKLDGKCGVSLTALNLTAQLAAWPTPVTEDARSSARNGYMLTGHPGTTLLDAARMASWSTPSARDWKDTPGMAVTGINPDGSERERLDQLPRQAHLVGGTTSSGSPAPTGARDQLSPVFSGWLQGYSPEHLLCAPSKIQKKR